MLVSRREFLKGAAAVGVAGILPNLGQAAPVAATTNPIAMAMHVHSSFSEGLASMHYQLAQAAANAVDVVWWTDHDWRMAAHGYRQIVHFSSKNEFENGIPLRWRTSTSGTPSVAKAVIKPAPASPLDTTPGSSLKLASVGYETTFSSVRCTADDHAARRNLRGSLAGLTMLLEVMPKRTQADAYLEIRVKTSERPATGGRPGGAYEIMYRIGGPDRPGTMRASGLSGLVVLDAEPDAWTSLALTPTADIEELWPDVEHLDAALTELSLAAASRNGRAARGFFDFLRFVRTFGGDPLSTQRQLMATYSHRFPNVRQHQGLEVSLYKDHLNWFGGALAIPDYGRTKIKPTPDDPAVTRQLIDTIHEAGGLASWNHMMGTAGGNYVLSQAQQDARCRSVASALIASGAHGADILEVGYRQRGGVGLSRHLAAWDACSRNAIFVTGNGASDTHSGTWAGQIHNFLTWAWASESDEVTLLEALLAGRCFFGDMKRFNGQVDMLVDGACPMGSVSVSAAAKRSVLVAVSGLPADGFVRVVRGPVDYAGAGIPEPGTTFESYPASEFATGSALISLDNASSSFVRVEVLDASGLFLAGSNPAWLLCEEPPSGIPVARAC